MNNNNENKVTNKMITKGKEEDYYGIQRTWCVGRLNIGKLLDLPEGEERWGRKEPGEMEIKYDFGKPCPNSNMDGYRIDSTRINRWDFEDAVTKTIDIVMLSGNRNDIVQTVSDKLRVDYTVSVMVTTYSKAGGYMNRVDVKLEKVGEETFKDNEITTDLKDITPYMSEQEFNVKANIEQPTYRTNTKYYNGNTAVEYLVKKILKEKYTYCTKSGKNIVPGKYLMDGEAGIKAYQNEKRSKNKNNSIEKQMVKNLKKEKTQFAFETFNITMKAMLGEGTDPRDWQQVFLAVDGRWNTGRRMKTIRTNILNMPEDKLIMLSEDEIKTRCKNYWKVQLQHAIDNINKII